MTKHLFPHFCSGGDGGSGFIVVGFTYVVGSGGDGGNGFIVAGFTYVVGSGGDSGGGR